MKLTHEQFQRVQEYLPKQRGNVTIDNYTLLNAILHIVEHGCKWRGLPERFGKWYTIYKRTNRWAKNGVLERVFTELQRKKLVSMEVKIVALDSTFIKVHPDGTGALKKQGNKASESQKVAGTPSFMWLPLMIKQF